MPGEQPRSASTRPSSSSGLPPGRRASHVLLGVVAAEQGRVPRALRIAEIDVDELPTMRAGIETVAEDTSALTGVENALGRLADEMAQMRQELARVRQATDVLPPMDGRMAHIEESMPVLAEVEQHLAKLPEVMEALRGSLELIGRVADRLPGNRRSAS